jgi:Terpene synthase family 2, C-terminal metal binding
MMTFGMGITIPDEEMEICQQLCYPAWVCAGLTNDLFSWQKEYEAAARLGQPNVVNAIWVMMVEHGISAEEAKDICRQKIKDHITQFVQIVKETKKRTDLSLDLRRYVEALQYSLSGNVVWSLECPRYHPEASHNKKQLDWMKNGVPETIMDNRSALIEADAVVKGGTTPASGYTNKSNGAHSKVLTNKVNGVKGANGCDHGSMANGQKGIKRSKTTILPPYDPLDGPLDLVLERNLQDLDTNVSAIRVNLPTQHMYY